jgi:hypothetical protein
LLRLFRLLEIGDVLSISSTKFDGKTPIFGPNFPRHHPSSIC